MDAKGRFEFLQRRGDFAAGGQFRSGGAFLQPISQLRNEEGGGGCKMALVCQGAISQLRSGAMAAKLGFLKLWGFRRAFRSYEMRLEAAKWHSCAKGVFCSCENFRRGRGVWGCEIISQRMVVFATKAQFRRGSLLVAK